MSTKEGFMKEALKEAKIALQKNEVPIGCVLVKDNQIVARGHNQRELTKQIIAHAEINALISASKKLDTWNLEGIEMYVTVEPCVMCFGAILQSRIKTIYIAAKQDNKKRVGFSNYLNEKDFSIAVQYDLLKEESKELMQSFFRNLRLKEKDKREEKND